MSRQEIENAVKLQEQLLDNHEGDIFDDVFQGEQYNTPGGSCYKIEESLKIKLNSPNKDKVLPRILNDIKLIKGIGEAKERCLNKDGYGNIEDLLKHPQFRDNAVEFLNTLENSPLDCLTQRCSNSHPYLLYASSFGDIEDLLFFDIETMGLKDQPVILIGLARIKDNNIMVKQYLSTNLKDEKSMLEGFVSDLSHKTVFVSFNGRSFDLPFIKSRNCHHGIFEDLNFHHLDLLHFSRRTWGRTLPNCRLQTLEKYLFNHKRYDDVPSSQVPAFYQKYLQTGNIGPLIPIVEHNRQDVITLAMILSRLQEEHDKNVMV
ncbi:MAG: ribonuclease H-like domain-containing protein [Methanobacterium sp.]|nr:ribonuclease H-like domain-containing protein [Methanobacterium sp.]